MTMMMATCHSVNNMQNTNMKQYNIISYGVPSRRVQEVRALFGRNNGRSLLHRRQENDRKDVCSLHARKVVLLNGMYMFG